MIYADLGKVAMIGQEQLSKLDAAIEPTFDQEGKLLSFKLTFSSGNANQSNKLTAETVWGSPTITSGQALLQWLLPREEADQQGISFTLETRNSI